MAGQGIAFDLCGEVFARSGPGMRIPGRTPLLEHRSSLGRVSFPVFATGLTDACWGVAAVVLAVAAVAAGDSGP